MLAPAPVGPYATALSVFNGTNPNGTWSLYVADDTAQDAGKVEGWSLQILTRIVTANSPPVVIAARMTAPGVPITVPVYINDAETPGSLTIRAWSSNQTLVPDASIVAGGSGTSRTVTVTPAAGQTGQASISVSATDGGGLSATDSFVLVVR